MKFRNWIAAALSTAAVAAWRPPTRRPTSPSTSFSIVVGTTFPWGQGAEIWSNLVRERTQGRINIKVYPGTSLVQGDQTREFTAIRQGVIDMAVGSTINWSPQVKQLNLFSLPFLMPDYAAIDALVQGEVGKEMFKLIEKAGGAAGLGREWLPPAVELQARDQAPEDMKGMKLRVVGSPLYIDTFTALGANPTQMSWADAQPALASGAVDGQENPLSIYTGSKLYTVGQKYLTLWNYVADPLIFVVNREVWNAWSEKDREIVRQAALDAGKQQIVIARKGVTPEDPSLLKEIEGHGVTVTSLSQADHDAFAKITKPVYDKWKKQIGEELVNTAEKAIAARKK